jgi:hypothetical protein
MKADKGSERFMGWIKLAGGVVLATLIIGSICKCVFEAPDVKANESGAVEITQNHVG